ncbi:MAG: M14 metallopeptidase family protein [Pseudomonadota bacterium]
MNPARLIVALASLVSGLAQAQTSPEAFLGHKVGADRKLADTRQINAYFTKLAAESKRVSVVEIGKSTLGVPMLMAIVTSEKNMPNVDRYRAITKRLSDPRGLTAADARKLSQEGKVIVLITHGLHASEVGSSQASMETAYRLAVGDTPFDAAKVLDDVIVLLVPVANPDGLIMISDWYKKYLGTKYEGGDIPWLYHHYAGHDNNRDGIMYNLPETRAIDQVLWHDWFPQIMDDPHQMGATGARIFVPPYMEPADQNVHPLVFRGIGLIGSRMTYDLQAAGMKGAVHDQIFASAWWKGTLTCGATVRNTTAVFTEIAWTNIATPVHIDPAELEPYYTRKSLHFPDPWPGGWWRLRDVVDYAGKTSMSLIETASAQKSDWLYNYYQMGRDAVEGEHPGDPYAFVIPAAQHDNPTTLKLIEVLKFGGAEIQQATAPFVADGKSFAAGDFIVFSAQPYRPYVVNQLSRDRNYPDDAVPSVLRDDASWSLPLQMGVEYSQIEKPFKAEFKKLVDIPVPSVSVPATSYVVFDTRANASYAVAAALLNAKNAVYRSSGALEVGGTTLPAGSFIVESTAQVKQALPALLDKWRVEAYGLDSIRNLDIKPLSKPRIGVYQSWRPNMDEGWARYVLDDLGFEFTTLHNADLKGDLTQQFSVILFANESADRIKSGNSADSEYPPEVQGGIGASGVAALKAFAAKGGTIVAVDSAGMLFTKEFGLPVRNALEGLKTDDFWIPSSLVRIEVDNTQPLGYGMPDEATAMFIQSAAFTPQVPDTGESLTRIVARYPRDHVLIQGAMKGSEKPISGRAAVLEVKQGQGRVVLIGFRDHHRAQTYGTYKFLLNALLSPAQK